tara:strand:- start:496 stop:741 length:246 start_codon:yes stop_codon:yes gene_type:complete
VKNTKHINLKRKDSKADVLSLNEKKVLRKILINALENSKPTDTDTYQTVSDILEKLRGSFKVEFEYEDHESLAPFFRIPKK